MNLTILRKEKKITQEEMAKILNITQRTYSGYELSQTEPNIETLCKLADYFNVSIDYLVGREKNRELITKNYQQKKELLQLSEKLTNNNFQKLLIYGTALLDSQEA